MKRAFDIFCSAAGIVLLFPLFAAAAILIKLDSRGPVFFRQQRVGRNFNPFLIYKFRTMTVDASEKGPQITVGGDKRVTRVGRILRRYKIDELPQLINVLKGDMSLVGPRPEVQKYVELFREDYEHILRVRPGITDISSITYRDEEGVLRDKDDPEAFYRNVLLPEKIRLAKLYIDRSSFLYDLGLIWKTVLAVFNRPPSVIPAGAARDERE
ncbi:MAG: sugar transferase [Nitrospirae bacterium]|nr:sugar transferase [Nitrospirota bacterium]